MRLLHGRREPGGFGIKICDLKVSQLILFKEQSHPGRVIVAHKDHVSELVNISAEARSLFFEDVGGYCCKRAPQGICTR